MAKVKIPENQLEQAVREGAVSMPANQRVNVVDEKGELYDVPGDELKLALDMGYRIQRAEDKAISDYVEDNKGISGAAKVALGQFADEALMGIPETISDTVSDPFFTKKKDALKKYHENANDVGGVLGFGASMLVGGPIFKGATKAGIAAEKAVAAKLTAAGIERGSKSLAKDIVARSIENATRLGVEGAVVSTPKALTEAALGDPDAAAESLLAGGGIGLAFGLAGGPLGKSLEALRKKIDVQKASDFLGELSDERAAKALGMSKSQIKKLKGGQKEAEEIGNYMMDAALEGGEKVITPLSTTDDIYDRVLRMRDESGSKIGNIYKQLDEQGLGKIKIEGLENSLRAKVEKDFSGKLYTQERNILNNIVSDLKDLRIDATDFTPPTGAMESFKAVGKKQKVSDELSFDAVKTYMDRLADIAFPKGLNLAEPSPRQAVARKVWGALRGEVDNAVDAAVTKTGDASLKTTLAESRKAYSMSSKAKRSLEDKISSQAGNKLVGLTDTITGVGAAAVDPISALPAILAKKTFEKYGNQVGAGLFRKSADGVLMAEQFMDKVKARLDDIPFIMGAKNAGSGTSKSLTAIQQLLEDDSGKGKEIALKKLKDIAANTISNTEKSVADLSDKLQVIQDGGADQTAQSLSNAMVKTAKYISDAIPKDKTVQNPFYKAEYTPTDQEIASFQRKLAVVLDPFAAFDALADNTLTADHVDALAFNYPKIYNAMRIRVMDHVSENEQDFPYSKRLNLSLLLGLDADPSIRPDFIMSLQDSFGRIPQPEAKPEPVKVTGLNKMNPRETHQTENQRLLQRT